MLFFDLLYPPSMILMPLIVLVIYRPVEGADLELVQSTRKRLLQWTAAAISLFAAIMLADLALPETWTASNAGRLRGPVSQAMSFLFMPMWFLLAMPYVRAARPHLDLSPSQNVAVRSAKLVSRRALQVLPRWTRWAPAFVLVAATAYCFWEGFGTAALGLRGNVRVGLVLLVALLGINLLPSLYRAALSTPEPLPAQSSPELERAYAEFRSAKAWGTWTVATGFQLLLAAIAVGLVSGAFEASHSAMLGWVGGLGGSFLGILGGVFGGWIGFCGSRVNELRNQLTAE